jgi:1,4-alpha-glucan branching enzyme
MAINTPSNAGEVVVGFSLLTDYDIYLFKHGSHFRLYERLGAHIVQHDGRKGTHFALWAPNAQRVSVIGDFNNWNKKTHSLNVREDDSGIWEGFIPGVGHGALYKYHIESRFKNYHVDKTDPFALCYENTSGTASRVWDLGNKWGDQSWMQGRSEHNALTAPWSVYETHLGSWRRVPEEDNRFLTYREQADALTAYVHDMGFTHVELLPITEHPFYGSWGYQTTGYFAPTIRYGTPQDLMYLIDTLHRSEIGVVLDWVPSHFPADEHGLSYFDGTHLFEHSDPRRGFHPEWKSSIFNYGRNEVRSFLISSAAFWFDKYHIDAIRVDAVASMLYLDYARKAGEWVPNEFGGRENVDAIQFLRALNEAVYKDFPGVQTIAEESTAWPMVSRPVYVGGLGFGMKWNMGWMHDTLDYFSEDPIHRKYHHDKLTFGLWYAFTENFMLPLSHDEVVYGKRSLLGKMSGNEPQKFANLRLLFGFMYAHPGKKIFFMGGEFGQWREWNHDASLDWDLLEHSTHRGVQRWFKALNRFYRADPALHGCDFSPEGFEWVDVHDSEQSVLSFLRKNPNGDQTLVVCNFTPVVRANYRLGVPRRGRWREVLNSDAVDYGGSGHGNFGGVDTETIAAHGRDDSLNLTLPPLGVVFFKPEPERGT